MPDLLRDALMLFILVAPVGLGVYVVLFSRRFSLDMYRFRKEVWKTDFTERDVRLGQIFALVVGAGLGMIGLFVAARIVF